MSEDSASLSSNPEVDMSTVPPQPVKRRPGRPRKDASLNGTAPPVTPLSPGVEPPPPRRGRPPKKITEIDAGALAKQLQGIHKMAAMMTGLSVLEISAEESVMLAESLANVSREYDLSIDGKTGATIQMIGVAAMIYVPRIVEIRRMRARGNLEANDPNGAVAVAVN